MASWSQDVRYSLRSLARSPGFATVAVLSLALGIGVNTAIFSALNALLLRPLAVRDLDRAVYVYHADPVTPDRGTTFPAYQHYRDRNETFSAVMAFAGARPLVLIDGDRRDQVYAELVAGDFFSIADIKLRIGRPFDREIDRGVHPAFVTVLSHALWKRRFASDPSIVGKTVDLNGQPFIVHGVSEAGFSGLDSEASADLWIPMPAWAHLVGEPNRLTSEEHWLTTVAELREGVTLEQAQAAMAVAGQSIQPPAAQQTKVRSVRQRVSGAVGDALALGAAAFAAGLLVLILACTNVASLLTARAAARQYEMSVRMALGSSRSRLLRLWLTESLLLAVAAGIVGLFVASWILDLVVAFEPPTLIGQAEAPTLPLDIAPDLRVFVFALCLSALTAMVVGLISGIQGSNPGVMRATKGARTADRRFAPGFNVRSAVIALQMALAMILLLPCGLLVRSWLNASTARPGFSTENVLLLPISTDQGGVRVRKPDGFDLQLIERVAMLPGVETATVMDPVPLWFGGSFAHFSIEIGLASRAEERIGFARVGPRYFETLGIPLLRGRGFTASDNASASLVAVVNETMARRFWPDGNALGQHIRNRDRDIEIVGIARDAKYQSLAESAQPWLYRPLGQTPTDNATLSLAVRAAGDPMQLRSAIEREVRMLVPTWPAFQFRTLDEGLQLQQLLPRLGATLLGVLGGFGLLLAAIGVYGVMTYVVRQRGNEIGIRLALGSPTFSLMALVMKQSLGVCLTGAAAGIVGALLSTRLLSSLLYGVSAADPLTYAVVPLVLLAVALLACYLPARRVSRMNTVDALRQE